MDTKCLYVAGLKLPGVSKLPSSSHHKALDNLASQHRGRAGAIFGKHPDVVQCILGLSDRPLHSYTGKSVGLQVGGVEMKQDGKNGILRIHEN